MKHSIHEYFLTGGGRGLVIQVPGVESVTLSADVNSGTIFAPEGKNQVPHLMEHMAFSGTKTFSSSIAFKSEIERNGAHMNAVTKNLVTSYTFTCAAFEQERMLSLLGEQLGHLTFPEVSFPGERENVRAELLRNTTNDQDTCSRALYAELFPKTYTTQDEALLQLDRITLEDVKEHYRRTHSQANATFYFAGDFENKGQHLVELFEKALKELPEGRRADFPKEPRKILEEPILIQRPIKQLYYNLTFSFDPDGFTEKDRLALTAIRLLLTGGWQSMVYGEAREKGLAYGAFTTANHSANAASFTFFYNVVPENAPALFKLFSSSMRKIRKGQIEESELARVKQMHLGTLAISFQTPASLIHWYDEYTYDTDIWTQERYIKEFQKLTIIDLQETAEKVLKADGRGLSLVGDIEFSKAQQLYDILQQSWI